MGWPNQLDSSREAPRERLLRGGRSRQSDARLGSAHDRRLAEVTAAKPSLKLGGQEAVRRDRLDPLPSIGSLQSCPMPKPGSLAIRIQGAAVRGHRDPAIIGHP